MGAVTVLEELPRRSMSVRTIWTTASLTSAIWDRASTPCTSRGDYNVTGFLHPSDEVVKEAEAATVEGEAVDFPEVDADRKHEATLRRCCG